MAVKSEEISCSNGKSTPQKRILRSNADVVIHESPVSSPSKRKSPRRCVDSSNNTPTNGIEKLEKECKSPVKKNTSNNFSEKPNWNPRDIKQTSAVKEALHLSTAPSSVVCREDEQKRVFDFCKACIEQEKAGSLYVCGCPGTGKSLSMEKVKQCLVDWAKEAGFQPPDVLAMNCTSLAKTSEIFNKMMEKTLPRKKIDVSTPPLQHLQNLYSQQQQSMNSKMMLIIADELDYLVTKDCAVLYDLFMLTALPFSRCILIGVANAIDLADRFLPRLKSLNCKPMVITFRAYSKDQIIRILQERLLAVPYLVFHPKALELCARKVAAASGDMRKALCVCRSAIEILESELRESTSNITSFSTDKRQKTSLACIKTQENDIVRIDHMAVALSKAFRSPIVDTIQSLPQHQQIILCAAVKFFNGAKKDTTVGELNKSYMEICKSAIIPPVGIFDFLNMCIVVADQGLLKLGQSRDDKLKRVTLKVDEADVTYALQGIRFFRNCLQ
ncbi:cell division control protein [Salix suchowensis]|nr:cell division control protein [Salix suchowensis]